MSLILDDRVFRQRINRLLAALPPEVAGPVLREEAGQFVRKVVAFLPPKTLVQGRRAVARDVGRTMMAMDPKTFTDKSIQAILKGGDLTAQQALVDRLPTTKGKGMRVGPFSADVHKKQRNRSGRVSAKTVPRVIAGRGSSATVKSYVKAVQGRVGFLKSGYVRAAVKLGVRLPAFVTRHPQLGQGGIDIVLNNPKGLNHITITNRAGRYPDHMRVVRDALRSRVKAIGTKLMRLLRGKAVNLGFARTGGS